MSRSRTAPIRRPDPALILFLRNGGAALSMGQRDGRPTMEPSRPSLGSCFRRSTGPPRLAPKGHHPGPTLFPGPARGCTKLTRFTHALRAHVRARTLGGVLAHLAGPQSPVPKPPTPPSFQRRRESTFLIQPRKGQRDSRLRGPGDCRQPAVSAGGISIFSISRFAYFRNCPRLSGSRSESAAKRRTAPW